MDSTQLSELIGRYLRSIVSKKTELYVHALRDGKGSTTTNPFTGERLQLKVAGDVARLAAELAERGLSRDTEFMSALGAAAAEFAEAPLRQLLEELSTLQRLGDGGPDPEFSLALPGGEPVQMAAVVKEFDRR